MRQLIKGALAGMAGTLVVQLLSSRQPGAVYEPSRLVARLSERYLGRRLSQAQGRRYGLIMRWLYGPSWGALLGEVEKRWPIPYPVAAVALAGSILIFELSALPLTGATPSLKRWGWHQIAGDGLQTMLFGVAAASAMALMDDDVGVR